MRVPYRSRSTTPIGVRASGAARRFGLIAAVAVLGATGLSACGGGGGGGSAGDFCDALKDAQSNSSADPSLDELAQSFSDVADKAPSDIKDDVQTIADAFNDPTSADSDKIVAAATRLETWVGKNCSGVDIGGLGG